MCDLRKLLTRQVCSQICSLMPSFYPSQKGLRQCSAKGRNLNGASRAGQASLQAEGYVGGMQEGAQSWMFLL